MATQEDTVLSQYVPGFRANLQMAPQQKDSKLIGAVESDLNYTEPGEMYNADDVLPSDPEDVQGRVPDTPDKFPAFDRTVGFFKGFHDSAWLDKVDQARELEDPTSPIMAGMMAGRWRKADARILVDAIGTRYSKPNNAEADNVAVTANAFPATQIVAASDVSLSHDGEVVPTNGSDYGLSVGKLLLASELLDESEVEGDRYIAVGPRQISDLLRRTPATSSYYAEVKALNTGTISEFLGFRFIKFPKARVPFVVGHDSASANRQCVAWVKPALIYKSRPIVNASIRTRADKSDTPQAFYKSEHSAARRYDKGVVRIDCYEGPAY